MKEIGGFFELSFGRKNDFHRNAIALNSARNCLKYLLQINRPSKVYVPAYCCNSLLEPILEEGVVYDFYHLDSNLEIKENLNVKDSEKIIYINYFGLKRQYISKLVELFDCKLMVDNTQAFFEKPIYGIDTFYSPRKFFGVSDGGYLYTAGHQELLLEKDESTDRISHVLARLETGASANYALYQQAEASLREQPVRAMSALTTELLANVDYEKAALIRQRNYWALHSELKSEIATNFAGKSDYVPMVYPLAPRNSNTKKSLIENKIYTATYWLDAKSRVNRQELFFVDEVVYLPIDQRYTLQDMWRIVEVLHG